MREYLFSSKILTVEIKYGLSAFPEKQLLIVVLVNSIHWVSHVPDHWLCNLVTVLHPQNSLEGGEHTLLWHMRNERQRSCRKSCAWGQVQDCGTWLSLSPNPIPFPFQAAPYEQIQFIKIIWQGCVCAFTHILEGVRGRFAKKMPKNLFELTLFLK